MNNLATNINLFSFAKKIKRPLILDGAMGSMLQSMNVKTHRYLWMSYANIESTEKVFDVHKKYIEAGVDIITTNTFRTNPSAIKSTSKIKPEKFVKKSVEIALQAKNNLPVLIAGSNPPAEDCYQVERTLTQKELILNHQKHIDLLMNSGCDFVLNETQSHFDEIKIICKYCKKENIPFVISFFFKNDLTLLSGEKLSDALEFVLNFNPLAIGFNCIMPSVFHKAFRKINDNYNWGFYLNCGSGNYSDEIIKCGISPQQYLSQIKAYIRKNPSFIGSCCGSSPEHIKKIKSFLDGRNKS